MIYQGSSESLEANLAKSGKCRGVRLRMRERVALQDVHLETLDAARELSKPGHDLLHGLKLVIVETEGRHGCRGALLAGRALVFLAVGVSRARCCRRGAVDRIEEGCSQDCNQLAIVDISTLQGEAR